MLIRFLDVITASKSIVKLNVALEAKDEEENDKLFRLRELFKLTVNENIFMLQEMATRIETLRNEKIRKAQEGVIIYQAIVDERNISDLIDSQWNNKNRLFGEILAVFSENRIPEETKENQAFYLDTKGNNIISNMCYQMKMPHQ